MITLINTLLSIAAILLLIPVSVLWVQVVAAMPRARAACPPPTPRPTIAILIPAHNEGAGLHDTLASLKPQLIHGDRLLVVADNCTDNTTEFASHAGAEVIQRHDMQRRGKGYALDFGMRHLAQHPPELVIIVDADCIVDAGAVDYLARLSMWRMRPVQALYLMLAPNDAGLKTRIAEFAWRVRNHLRPLGFYRMGLPCQLMGSGMAFPWSLISTVEMASGEIVEDMKLGIDLACCGHAPLFCPQVRVTSVFPNNAEGTQSQRTRWEHGHLSMIAHAAPRLLGRAVGKLDVQLLALTLDMSVPPLALLTLLTFFMWVLTTLFYLFTGVMGAWWWSSLVLSLLFFAVMLAWLRAGRDIVPFGKLLLFVSYIFWKIPIYFKILGKRQIEWVRSKRDSE